MRKLAFDVDVQPYTPLIHDLITKMILRLYTCLIGRRALNFTFLRSYILHFTFYSVAVLHFAVSPLSAQNAPHPSFRQYTTDEGLASSEVFFILQDSAGFIWISTDNGVSRFDGYEFRNYGLKDGLVENVIFMMQLDTLGRLWMQAMSGNLYYMEGDSIHSYWNNKALLNFKGRPDRGRGFIVEDAGEIVHIATVKYGIITISKDGITTTYVQDEPIYNQVFEKNGHAIFAIFNNGEPGLLEAYKNKLLLQERAFPVYFNINEEQFSLSDLHFSFKKHYTPEVFSLGQEKYLFQMYPDLWVIENREVTQKQYFPHSILYAHLMNKGQLMVGLYGHKGLGVYKSVEAFRKQEGSTWLPGQSVNYFMEDREGGRWFASHEDGVFYAPADALMVYDLEAGLPDKKVKALAIKNSMELFVGLENGEVWHLHMGLEQWEKLPDIPGTSAISDLYFDRQNQQIWVARDTLFYLHNDQWISIKTPHPEVPFIRANRIMKSQNGKRMWLSNDRGFMSMNLSKKRTDNLHYGKDQRTFAIIEDYSGKIWVGQPTGLFEWFNGKLQERQKLHPTFSLRVEDIALMADSTLVIATKGGGVVFWKGDQFEQITTEEGLTADMLEGLYADEKGTIWAGTLNGLNRISGKWSNRQVEQITVSHGLPSNEINNIRTFGENVWVATGKGLVHFSNKKISHFSPKPIMASVLANNNPVDLTKPLKFRYKENNLAMRFFAINYKMNGKIPYRYRLDEGNWTQTLSRSINFPALPTGKCIFEVQAQNEDGVWSESTLLPFIINPPWWATWWVRGLMLIATLMGGWSIYLFRTRQLKHAHQIQMQIAELERSALQAQMNPHFIFNCLNSIQSFILQNDKESAIMYLGSFASLVRSMLNASVSGKILLVEEVKLLNNYLELEKLRFKNRFTYEVIAEEGLDIFDVKIPPLLVQPYVENALLHGISGKTSGGNVHVFFEKKESYIQVSIQDNGPGFKLEDGVAQKNKTHKSFGMSITRDRLELLSNNKGNNAVNTTTLQDAQGQVIGTKVTIQIF